MQVTWSEVQLPGACMQDKVTPILADKCCKCLALPGKWASDCHFGMYQQYCSKLMANTY